MPSPTNNTQTDTAYRPLDTEPAASTSASGAVSGSTRPPVRPRRGRRLALAVVLLALLAGCGLAAANRQSIGDWWRLRGYTPPAAVVRLAGQDTMNGYTRHLFYLNRPQLLPSVSAFRKHCPENSDTIVLGCYHSGQNGIFIYNVQDPKLAGVQQVTAAHEVLHAVYARLSDADRKSLDKQLQDFYQHGLTDQRVIAEVRLYQKTEPDDVYDEMSCTFGTELSKLPPGLEAYYKRYFTDRSAIVAFERQYESEFNRRETLIKEYDARLAALKTQIDALEADLNRKQAQLDSEQTRLNSERSNDVNAYNADVPAYNQLVDDFNAEIDSTQAHINQYNQLVASRNQVAGQLAQLDKALDTRLTPASTR